MTDCEQPKFDLIVRMTGTDGNVFALIGLVQRALRQEIGRQEAEEFSEAAFLCESYDEVLRLILRTVHVV